MIVNMTLQVTLALPDGSASMDGTHGRGWVLPNGQCVKPFAVYELNDERDLSYAEAMSLGLDIEDIVTEVEICNG